MKVSFDLFKTASAVQKAKNSNIKTAATVNSYTSSPMNNISGVPKSYVSFVGNVEEKPLNYSEDAKSLVDFAEKIALQGKNPETNPLHILLASVLITEAGIQAMEKEGLPLAEMGEGANAPAIVQIASQFANQNVLADEASADFFKENLQYFKEDIMEGIKSLPSSNNVKSAPMQKELGQELKALNLPSIGEQAVVATSFNAASKNGFEGTMAFLKGFESLSLYDDISKKPYVQAFDERAENVWKKLALGANVFATVKNNEDGDMLIPSIAVALENNKYGGMNPKNTELIVLSEKATDKQLLEQVFTLAQEDKSKNYVVVAKTEDILYNSTAQSNDPKQIGMPTQPFIGAVSAAVDNVKLILIENEDENYARTHEMGINSAFKEFLSYSVPPLSAKETKLMFKQMPDLAEGFGPKFTTRAINKVIDRTDVVDGAFPPKAQNILKKIAKFNPDKKVITEKDVNVFVKEAGDFFKDKSGDAFVEVEYDTGKRLKDMYGKETTKKDVAAIVNQIKSNKVGTKGMLIYSKDGVAGSGSRFTAQVIAGEAKAPFVEMNTSDFTGQACTIFGEPMSHAGAMKKVFHMAKTAAKQNENKAAVLYIQDFHNFVFGGGPLGEAMGQLSRDMDKAKDEGLNIIVIGSTIEEGAQKIPETVRGFNQILAVDSPARNAESRQNILNVQLKEQKLKLEASTPQEQAKMMNKLVNLTERMSFVEIKDMLDKTKLIASERKHKKAAIGDFYEAYLQLATGRTSHPETNIGTKRMITSHECGHATNLEVMLDLAERKGESWHKGKQVNFITLDPRGDFMGAVFEGETDNMVAPFETIFSDLVCAFGGNSCEKEFFNTDGSIGISGDMGQATAMAKAAVSQFGMGFHTGKISAAGGMMTPDTLYKDVDIMISNAQTVSDLITKRYTEFNKQFTEKYSQLIGTNECMVDGEEFKNSYKEWRKAQSPEKQKELDALDDRILEIIQDTKNGKKSGPSKYKRIGFNQ